MGALGTALQKTACLTLPMGGAFAHVSDEDKQCGFYCFLTSEPVLIKSSSMEPALHSGTTSGSFLVTVTELHACQDLSVHVPSKIYVLKLNSHPIPLTGASRRWFRYEETSLLKELVTL